MTEPAKQETARYAVGVSRLDNIVARNERARRLQPMTIVKLAIAGFLVVALVLTVFTSLGQPAAPARHPPRVDGVLLRSTPK